MPILDNSRYEAFAVARAKGASLDDAYEDAGFAPHRGHASRLMLRPEVADRIGELRADQIKLGEATTREMIDMLVKTAKQALASPNPARVKEARLNLAEAHKMRRELSLERAIERKDLQLNVGDVQL